MKSIYSVILLIMIIISGQGDSDINNDSLPKNIILFIGDGMGISQITATKIYSDNLNLEKFRNIGLMTTFSEDSLITDSGASATALATGYKTYNEAISVTKSGTHLKSVFEYAKEIGKSIGIVVSCTITHATPACFYAHSIDRNDHNLIAEHLTESEIDFFIGGGAQYFLPSFDPQSKRLDNVNLIDSLSKKMKILTDVDSLVEYIDGNKLGVFLALDELPKASERKYSLAELTQLAIKNLSKNDNGFILMVEGSQIDWAGHDNDFEYMISEMLDFDEAVGVGLDFALESETLIIVTADHETGGLNIINSPSSQNKFEYEFGTEGHTAAMVPIFSFGPKAGLFTGITDNAEVGKKIIDFVRNSVKINKTITVEF